MPPHRANSRSQPGVAVVRLHLPRQRSVSIRTMRAPEAQETCCNCLRSCAREDGSPPHLMLPTPTLNSWFELLGLQHPWSHSLAQRWPRWWVEPHGAAQCSGRGRCSGQEWTLRVALQLLDDLRRHLRVSGEHHGQSAQLAQYAETLVRVALLRPTPPNTNGRFAQLLMSSSCVVLMFRRAHMQVQTPSS